MRILPLIIAALTTLLLMSCGGRPLPSDLGDACLDYADVFCERALDCGFVSDQAICESGFVNSCCAANDTCDASTTLESADEWNECLDAVDAQSCAAIESAEPPAACRVL